MGMSLAPSEGPCPCCDPLGTGSCAGGVTEPPVEPVPGEPDPATATTRPYASIVSFDLASLSGAAITLLILGTIASVYGPLLGTISHRYDVSLPVAGITLIMNFIGALIGSLTATYLVRRTEGRNILLPALLVIAAGAALIAIGEDWAVFVFSVAVVGVGFGVLDFSLNHLLARTKVGGRAARLTVVNATYGVGAVAGPLLIDWLTARRFTDLFAGMAILAALVSLSVRGLAAPPTGKRASANPAAGLGHRLHGILGVERQPLLGVFFMAYLLYVAVETSTSGWLATQIHGSGYSIAVGGLVTAGFWGGLAIGRILAAPLHRFVSERSFVIGGLAIAIVLALGASSAKFALVAYPIEGLALAAVYPMGLSWYTQVETRSAYGVSFLLLGAMAGGVVGPGLESTFVSAFGLRAVPFVIAALTCADLVVFAVAAAVTSKPIRGAEFSADPVDP